MKLIPMRMSSTPVRPFEWIDIEPDRHGTPLAAPHRERVMVDVIHDGNYIPEEFLTDQLQTPILGPKAFPDRFVKERDWGAELVAHCLASALHLGGYYRVNLSRALLDFGRFPGSSPMATKHMNRFAIIHPFSDKLDHAQKHRLLSDYYDQISEGMDKALRKKLLKIAIHTYDERNPSNSRRPAVSLLNRSEGHQKLIRTPLQNFDPLFPSELAEFTADRLLATRIALALEENAIHVADNYPYSLPEGSVEVRAQVWYFFQYLQRAYEGRTPPTNPPLGLNATPRDLVWNMLHDTNLRSSTSDALRSYLHMYRTPPAGMERSFLEARQEYDRIRNFLEEQRSVLVDGYRNALDRPSTLLIEVRKDLIWEFNNGLPVGPKVKEAQFITRHIARAISEYMERGRADKARAQAENLFKYE